MKEEEVESLLKEALIKKYGDKCSKCGKEGNLNICQILGQANSEYQYFLHCTRLTGYDMDYPYYIHNYYLNNFDAESEFLGLICNICVIISPQYPTYEEVMTALGDFWAENNLSELQVFMQLHPHTKPIIFRLFRLMNFNFDSSCISENGSSHDNLGETFDR